MNSREAVIAASWEIEERWALPELGTTELHTRAVIEALRSCGLSPSDVDGLACGTDSPTAVAAQAGLKPKWLDGTMLANVGTVLHLRHAQAAIATGMADVIVVVHAESNLTRIGPPGIRVPPHPSSALGQFDLPTGIIPAGRAAIGLRCYLDTFGITEEDLAVVPVVERKWAASNNYAVYRDPITVDDVLNSTPIAAPLRRLHCGVLTDNAGALVVTSKSRAAELTEQPVFLGPGGESYDSPFAWTVDPIRPSALRGAATQALESAGLSPLDLSHLMIFDGFAHAVLLGLEAIGICGPGEAADLVRSGVTSPGGTLAINTNGGYLNYRHGEMAQIQEAARRIRLGQDISLVLAMGQAFTSAAALILSRNGYERSFAPSAT